MEYEAGKPIHIYFKHQSKNFLQSFSHLNIFSSLTELSARVQHLLHVSATGNHHHDDNDQENNHTCAVCHLSQ